MNYTCIGGRGYRREEVDHQISYGPLAGLLTIKSSSSESQVLTQRQKICNTLCRLWYNVVVPQIEVGESWSQPWVQLQHSVCSKIIPTHMRISQDGTLWQNSSNHLRALTHGFAHENPVQIEFGQRLRKCREKTEKRLSFTFVERYSMTHRLRCTSRRHCPSTPEMYPTMHPSQFDPPKYVFRRDPRVSGVCCTVAELFHPSPCSRRIQAQLYTWIHVM